MSVYDFLRGNQVYGETADQVRTRKGSLYNAIEELHIACSPASKSKINVNREQNQLSMPLLYKKELQLENDLKMLDSLLYNTTKTLLKPAVSEVKKKSPEALSTNTKASDNSAATNYIASNGENKNNDLQASELIKRTKSEFEEFKSILLEYGYSENEVISARKVATSSTKPNTVPKQQVKFSLPNEDKSSFKLQKREGSRTYHNTNENNSTEKNDEKESRAKSPIKFLSVGYTVDEKGVSRIDESTPQSSSKSFKIRPVPSKHRRATIVSLAVKSSEKKALTHNKIAFVPFSEPKRKQKLPSNKQLKVVVRGEKKEYTTISNNIIGQIKRDEGKKLTKQSEQNKPYKGKYHVFVQSRTSTEGHVDSSRRGSLTPTKSNVSIRPQKIGNRRKSMIATAVSSVQKKEVRSKVVSSTDTAGSLSKKKGWTAESEKIEDLRTRNRELRKSVRYMVGTQENPKSSANTVSLNYDSTKKKTRDELLVNESSRRHSLVKDRVKRSYSTSQSPPPPPPPPPSPPPSPSMVPKVPIGTNNTYPTVAINNQNSGDKDITIMEPKLQRKRFLSSLLISPNKDDNVPGKPPSCFDESKNKMLEVTLIEWYKSLTGVGDVYDLIESYKDGTLFYTLDKKKTKMILKQDLIETKNGLKIKSSEKMGIAFRKIYEILKVEPKFSISAPNSWNSEDKIKILKYLFGVRSKLQSKGRHTKRALPKTTAADANTNTPSAGESNAAGHNIGNVEKTLNAKVGKKLLTVIEEENGDDSEVSQSNSSNVKKSVILSKALHDSSKAKRINNFKNERRRSVTRKVSKFATDRNKNASEIQKFTEVKSRNTRRSLKLEPGSLMRKRRSTAKQRDLNEMRAFLESSAKKYEKITAQKEADIKKKAEHMAELERIEKEKKAAEAK
eukprot:g473.t1